MGSKFDCSSRRESVQEEGEDSERTGGQEDTEKTPTHKPMARLEGLEGHLKELQVVKLEHQEEMDQLRKYFERVCREQEARYSALDTQHFKTLETLHYNCEPLCTTPHSSAGTGPR